MNPMPPSGHRPFAETARGCAAGAAPLVSCSRTPHQAPRVSGRRNTIERAAEPQPEAARDYAGAQEIPEALAGTLSRRATANREPPARSAKRCCRPPVVTGVPAKIERVVNGAVIHARAGQADDRERDTPRPTKAGSPTIARARRSRECRGKCQAEEHLELTGDAEITRITLVTLAAVGAQGHVSAALDSRHFRGNELWCARFREFSPLARA